MWSYLSSSVPSKYLFLRARRKFGFNKKIRRKLFIVYMNYQPNSCTSIHLQSWMGWSTITFLRQQKKVPPAHAQLVFCEKW
jgi:hypothetical protein